jgi:hypothetical protein
VPLRTFGQLKQLWEARVEGPPDSAAEMADPFPQATADQPSTAPNPSQDHSEPAPAPASLAPETDPQTNTNSV